MRIKSMDTTTPSPLVIPTRLIRKNIRRVRMEKEVIRPIPTGIHIILTNLKNPNVIFSFSLPVRPLLKAYDSAPS